MAKFRWNVEIAFDEELVADGLEVTERFLQEALAAAVPYVRSSSTRVRVLAGPDADDIARAQGFASALDKAARETARHDPDREEPTTARLTPRSGERARS